MLSIEAIRQLENLLDHYPDAAEPLIEAVKNGRLRGNSFLDAQQPPCGCVLGITVFSAKHAQLVDKVEDEYRHWAAQGEADVAFDAAAADLAHDIRLELLGDHMQWFEFEWHIDADSTPALISTIENWQERRLQEQAERRVYDA